MAKNTAKKHPTQRIAKAHKQHALSSVRIISGHLKRRQIQFIDAEGLRPTPDRLRETLFSWLMHDLHDAHVLDACAGSGVLGFEALSRGAAHVTFIEANAKQVQQLKLSQKALALGDTQVQILTGEAQHILPQLAQAAEHKRAFDVVFIDPPYALDLWQPILQTLLDAQLIAQHSLIYMEADQPIETLIPDLATAFDIHKRSKVGQVYAGLLKLSFVDADSYSSQQ